MMNAIGLHRSDGVTVLGDMTGGAAETLHDVLRLEPGDLICGIGGNRAVNTGLLFMVTDRGGASIARPDGGPLGRVRIRVLHAPPGLEGLVGLTAYAAEHAGRDDPGGVHGRVLRFPSYQNAEEFFSRRRLRRVAHWPEGLSDNESRSGSADEIFSAWLEHVTA